MPQALPINNKYSKFNTYINDSNKPTGRPSVRGNVPTDVIYNVARAARDVGVDPKIAIAMALQETNLGARGAGRDNPFHIRHDDESPNTPPIFMEELNSFKKIRPVINPIIQRLNKDTSFYNKDTNDYDMQMLKEFYKNKWDDDANLLRQEYEKANLHTPEHQALSYLKQRMNQQKNKPLANKIQAYNGLGKIGDGRGETDKGQYLYGRKDVIDTRKDPVYGKRVMQLIKEVIEKSPELLSLMENVYAE